MAMTAAVKDELSRLKVTKPCCRKAEVSAILRFASGLHIVGGKIVIEADLDTAFAARRLRKDIAEVFGHSSEMAVVHPGGLRKGNRYLVRVHADGEQLARQTGLVDASGRPARGLPTAIVNGSLCDSEAAWRGAFLAHGSLTEPGRSSALEVTCPGPEAALALSGAARRLGHRRQAPRGARRRPGGHPRRRRHRRAAHPARRARVGAWPGRSGGCAARSAPPRTAWPTSTTPTFAAPPGPPSPPARASQRALEILGDEVPDHLAEAGDCAWSTSRPRSRSSAPWPTRP